MRNFYLLLTAVMLLTNEASAQYNKRIRLQLDVSGLPSVPYETVRKESMGGWENNFGYMIIAGGGITTHYMINRNISAGLTMQAHYIANQTYSSSQRDVEFWMLDTTRTFITTVYESADVESLLAFAGLSGRYTINPTGKVQLFAELNLGYAMLLNGIIYVSPSSFIEPVEFEGFEYNPDNYDEFVGDGTQLKTQAYPEDRIGKFSQQLRLGLSLRMLRNFNLTAGVSYLNTGIDYQVISSYTSLNKDINSLDLVPYTLNLLQPFAGLTFYLGKGSERFAPRSKTP